MITPYSALPVLYLLGKFEVQFAIGESKLRTLSACIQMLEHLRRAQHSPPHTWSREKGGVFTQLGVGVGIKIWICTQSSYPDYKLSDLPKGVGEGLISGFAHKKRRGDRENAVLIFEMKIRNKG